MGAQTVLTRATLAATLLAAASCRHAPAPSDPRAPRAASAAERSELEAAVARYHDFGELEPLRAWLSRNPAHDDAEIWREVIALRTYENIAIGDPSVELAPGGDPAVAALPDPDPHDLVALAEAYPETLGGRTAQALLEDEGLQCLSAPTINPTVISFLEGGDEWIAVGDVTMPNVDLAAFRQRHEARLRDRIGEVLVADGCTTKMGYCTWWVRQFPEAAATPAIHDAMYQVWQRRAHPRWEGRNHAACAFACARKCRQGAQPLDDTCYDSCTTRCG